MAWRIVQDHERPGLLFAATEFGVFFTIDGGEQWVKLAGGVPVIPFRDLVIQKRENDLVGATFGRGFFILDDYTPLRHITEQSLQAEALLFPVRDAHWYIPKLPLGDFEENGKSSQGDSFYVAPNPPFGAVFAYYLRDGLKTAEESRREEEKKLEEQGEDTPYPGWEALRNEEAEDHPAIVLTVSDADGNVIRRIEGPVEPGFHRVAWDLRYAKSSPWTPEQEGDSYIEIPGPLARPGSYRVSMAKRVNGRLTPLGDEQSFEVVPMRERGLKGASAGEVVAFAIRLDDLTRQVSGAESSVESLLTEAGAIKQTLLRSTAPDALRDRARAIELELLELQQKIEGNERRDLYQDIGPVPINQRLQVAVMGNFRSTYGPTATHLASVEIAESQFADVKARLKRIHDSDLPALRQQLNEAGVPWTPGRGIPGED